MAVRSDLTSAARSARSIYDVVGELREALAAGDDEGARYARDRLERLARTAIGDGDSHGVEAEPPDHPVADDDDVLVGAVRDLGLADALFSASLALGEGGAPPAPERLDATSAGLDQAATVLERRLREPDVHGFESAARRSADLPAAVAALKEQLSLSLGLICARSGDVVGQAVRKIPRVGDLVEAAGQLGKRPELGAVQGGLAALAVRALKRALAAMHALIPVPLLDRVRQWVAGLAAELERGTAPATVVMDRLLNRARIESQLAARLDRPGLDRDRLDRASAELKGIEERFSGHMALVSTALAISGTVLTTAAAVAGATGALAVALASPVVAAGITVLLLGVVVVLAVDYADSWRLPAVVRGVRTVVEEATP